MRSSSAILPCESRRAIVRVTRPAEVIAMLQRDEGVTIEDLTAATGWLPHTARAAMTGLRKRGYSVVRERVEAGGSAYRISRPADGKGQSDSPDTAVAPDRRRPKARLAA